MDSLESAGPLSPKPSNLVFADTSWDHISESYYLKTFLIGDGILIRVTDMMMMWDREFSKSDLIKAARSDNPDFEANDECMFDTCYNLFHPGEDVNVIYAIKVYEIADNLMDTRLDFKLRTNLEGIPFKLETVLAQTSPKLFFHEVSMAILLKVDDLQKQREELCKIIASKDEEISEYKLGGAVLGRSNVATKLFNKDEFISNNNRRNKIRTTKTSGEKIFVPDGVFKDVLCNAYGSLIQYSNSDGTNDNENEYESIVEEPGESASTSQQQNTRVRTLFREPTVFPSKKRRTMSKLTRLF